MGITHQASGTSRVREPVLELELTGRVATVSLSGPMSAAELTRLDQVMDWAISAGAQELHVHLGAEQIDSGLLELLRATRSRLGTGLEVTADRAQPSAVLGLVGLIPMPGGGR